MKRFICVLIVCLLVVPAAFATDFENFNIHAGMFGGHDLSDGDARGDRIRFIQDGCTITFGIENDSIKSALVQGDGDFFLAYSLATLLEFDPSSVNVAYNGGQLLLYYLMGKEEPGKHMGQTESGCYFQVERENEGYSFMIMK